MLDKNRLKKEYEDSNVEIQKMVEEAIREIEEKIGEIRKETEKIGEEAESSLNTQRGKKKKN